MWTVENLSNEDSSHCGDHNDNRDGNKNGSNCERMSEEELERGERFFLSNDATKEIRTTMEHRRGAHLQPSTIERPTKNDMLAEATHIWSRPSQERRAEFFQGEVDT
jgi:hypothetical protein